MQIYTDPGVEELSITDDNEPLAIYIHWPFCLSKCPYCDFVSVPQLKNDVYDFARCLLIDLQRSLEKIDSTSIRSVFFGGGTPSLMSSKSIENIIAYLLKNHKICENVEVTLEANPGTFDEQNALDFRSAGINRLSLGIQSFSDINLQFLGRIYDSQQAYASAEIVAKIFDNFSVDLMYGYECQDIKSLEKDLISAINLGCKHLSCYQLTFEEATPFYEKLLSGIIKKLDSAQEAYLFEFINAFLKKYDIHRYEISNYCKKDYESKHNLAYWKYFDYLGIGPGAHSRITIDERKNEIVKISDPHLWRQAIKDSRSTDSHVNSLTVEEELQEMIIMGLRMSDGIAIESILKRIPRNILDKIITHEKIKQLANQKLIKDNDEKIIPTDIGFLKLNAVVEFLLL